MQKGQRDNKRDTQLNKDTHSKSAGAGARLNGVHKTSMDERQRAHCCAEHNHMPGKLRDRCLRKMALRISLNFRRIGMKINAVLATMALAHVSGRFVLCGWALAAVLTWPTSG